MKIVKRLLVAVLLLIVLLVGWVYLAPESVVRAVFGLERQRSGLVHKEIALPDGLRFVYLEGGGGEPLMLLHGFGGDKDNFTRVARTLTPALPRDHSGPHGLRRVVASGGGRLCAAGAGRTAARVGEGAGDHEAPSRRQLDGRRPRDDLGGESPAGGRKPLAARSGRRLERAVDRASTRAFRRTHGSASR